LRYISTRHGSQGNPEPLGFEDVMLAGLARDGGLYLPAEWPHFSKADIAALQGQPYTEVAYRVMRPFVGEAFDEPTFRRLIGEAYASFETPEVAPLKALGDSGLHLLELFHGPTLAFKDVALQLLGRLFEEFLARRDQPLTIVGATSGDTGSAAIDAVAGRHNIQIFMLHPKGRVSDVQRRQMTTVKAPNVHNIALEGASFDDAQAMVKRMFGDAAMTARFNIGAVNSINWARLMAQVVYYFAAALQLCAPHRKVAFSVPTGNFGDVFAGYVAAQIERLIVATNVNDILHRALANGDYSCGTVSPTAAPSMDIQVSSNFERLLFDAGGRDGMALAEQMRGFEASKAMRLTNAQREGAAALLTSCRADATEMAQAMAWAARECGEVIDPHTAIGLHAARAAELQADVPVVTLATAHPAKFPDAVERATGQRPPLPSRVGDLFEREERCTELPGDYAAVAAYVAEHATPAA
jgi:threonine synthase